MRFFPTGLSAGTKNCQKRSRGLKNRPPVPDEAAHEARDEAPSPETRAADQEIANALASALDALPEDQREVVLLRDVEGLTTPEAAEVLGISVDALKSRLHRARSALRERLVPITLEPSTSCPDAALQWSRKLEGDLSAIDCRSMEEHLATCARCSATCDALKQALGACQRSSQGTVPPQIQARVKAAVRDYLSMPMRAPR